MQPTQRTSSRQAQRRLVALFQRLGEVDRASVLAFAEFLANRNAPEADLCEPKPLPEPKVIPQPEGESVIAAIRRLSASYYMLDRGPLLHEASRLMAAHVMQGRPTGVVIDELEKLFAGAYEKFREQSAG